MEGLHSLLNTVGFFIYFPFQVLCVLFTKPANSTRERDKERERQTGRHRGRGRESAPACARATFGALPESGQAPPREAAARAPWLRDRAPPCGGRPSQMEVYLYTPQHCPRARGALTEST
jgi:hypothetical protein